MTNFKPLLIAAVIGALAGAASAYVVLQSPPPGVEQAFTAADLASISSRLARLEADARRSGAVVARPEPGERANESEVADIDDSAAEVADPLGFGGRAAFREGFRAVLDETLAPDERRAEAYKLLNSRAPPARLTAISALVNLDDPAALPAIRELVDDMGANARSMRFAEAAIDALAGYSGTEADALLYEYLEHEQSAIRLATARALEKRGDVSPMASMVADIADGFTSRDAGERSRTAQALGRTQSPSAIEPLVEAMQDDSAEVRLRAVQSLGAAADEASVAALTAALDDPVAEVRSAASRSLDRVRNPGRASNAFGRGRR